MCAIVSLNYRVVADKRRITIHGEHFKLDELATPRSGGTIMTHRTSPIGPPKSTPTLRKESRRLYNSTIESALEQFWNILMEGDVMGACVDIFIVLCQLQELHSSQM